MTFLSSSALWGVGADSGLQAEAWRRREAAMAGGRLGTETAGSSPATNNSPPQTAQRGALASAGLGGLGRCGRKSVTLSLPPLCVRNSHLPPGAHPSLRCTPRAHAHVLGHMAERRLRVTGAADGSSESRK